MFNLKSLIQKMISLRFYDGEQGAAGGAASPAPDGGTSGAPAALEVEGIPSAAIESDPEYQQMLEEERAENEKKGKEGKEGDKPGPDEGTAPAKGDEPGAEGEDKGKKDDKEVEEEEDLDISTLDLADDVIPGIKGEHLKALPKEALLAIADFNEKNKVSSEQAEQTKGELEKLLADSVVKRRHELIKQGKQDFDVRGLNEKEKKSMISELGEKFDLNPQEAEQIFDVFKVRIDEVVKQAANDTVQNILLDEDRQQKSTKTQKEGRQLFLSMGKFNKDLAFKETDASKFWTDDGKLNDRHPEAKKFREKVYPIMQSFAKAKIGYNELLTLREEYGEEGLYALAAKKHGLSVAINTAARDTKMLNSELRKKLAPLMKGSSVAELNAKGGGVGGSSSPSKAVIKHGYDVERLHTDADYYEQAYTAKGTDKGHMDLIDRLAEEGETLVQRKQKTRK
jgi:hypothetical protein